MRLSQVIGLCLLSGVGCGFLGAMIGTRLGDNVHPSRSDPHATAEVREELRQLRRAINRLVSPGVRGDGDEPAKPPESDAPGPPKPTEPRVDPAKRRENLVRQERARIARHKLMQAEYLKRETLRKRALKRTRERLEAQERAMLDAARADDLAGLVGAWLQKEDLERATMQIRNSADNRFLSKMAAGG